MDTSNINSDVTAVKVAKGYAVDPMTKKSDTTHVTKAVSKIDPTEVVKDLAKAVNILNEALAKDPVGLRFSMDETLKRPIVTVISEETGEVIHQLPQEDVLRAVKNIDQMRGILFEDQG